MHNKEVKVLIVGAGPAGVSTALFLSKKGISSTVIDKEFFPRDKICGDGLTPWVVTMLHKLDMGLVEELRASEHSMGWSGVDIVAPNFKKLHITNFYKKRPDEPPGYTIRRKEFDEILIRKVKENPLIELIEGVKVTGFEELESGTRLLTDQNTRTYEGDMVVYCDGANSEFSQKHGGMPKEHDNWLTTIKTYYHGLYPDYTPQTPADFQNNKLELYCLNGILPGYLWIFPLANGDANVGLGMRTDVLKKRRINLKTSLYQLIEENPELKERFKLAKQISPIQAWRIPIGVQKRSLSGNRYLIAGDAASLCDPGTGEGVGNSLNSGFHAAEHIADCIHANRFDAEYNLKYDQRVYTKLWKELKLSKIVHWFVMRPKIMTWSINRAISDTKLRDKLISMLNDEEEQKKLRRPWFYLRVLLGRKIK